MSPSSPNTRMTRDTSTSSSVKPDMRAREFMSVASIGRVAVAVGADRRPAARRNDDAARRDLGILRGVRNEADAGAGAAGFAAGAGKRDVWHGARRTSGVRAADVETRVRVLR